MQLNQIEKGKKAGCVELTLLTQFYYPTGLLRLSVETNDGNKVNLFISNSATIPFFKELRPQTKISLQSYTTTMDCSVLKKFLPASIDPEKAISTDSTLKFHLELTFPLSSIYLEFGGNFLDIPAGALLSSVDLSTLYQQSSDKVAVTSQEKYQTLKEISEKLKFGKATASCWAVIIDCCDSYIKPDSSDYLITYKITDPSIFPRHANINIFHKDPKELPKIENFGDIILLNSVQFKEYKGSLYGTISSGIRNMSFFVFNYLNNSNKPYGSYKNLFIKDPESEYELQKLSNWVQGVFEIESPTFLLESSKKVSDVEESKGEFDIIAKVLGVFSLGTDPADPYLLLLMENGISYQLVLPSERKRLVYWIKAGDTVRIRSLTREKSQLFLNEYSEILKIPFKRLKVPENPDESKIVDSFYPYFTIQDSVEISSVTSKALKFPEIGFGQLADVEVGRVVRIRGFLLNFKPAIRTKMIVWDGFDESNKFEAFVDQDDLFEFLNGNSLDNICDKIAAWDKVFVAAVEVNSEGFRVIHTRLNN